MFWLGLAMAFSMLLPGRLSGHLKEVEKSAADQGK
jgi:hypothetical protein